MVLHVQMITLVDIHAPVRVVIRGQIVNMVNEFNFRILYPGRLETQQVLGGQLKFLCLSNHLIEYRKTPLKSLWATNYKALIIKSTFLKHEIKH